MAITRTVQTVIEIIQEHEDIANLRALELLNEAHLFMLGRHHLVPDVTINITLTNGVGEYALPDNIISIWDAAYYSDANTHFPLRPTNIDTLYNTYGANWQLISPGQPWGFYERGGNIGLFPPPNATSAGGYPTVTLYCTQSATLGLGDTLPTTINTVYPWVYRVLIKQSPVTAPEKVAYYEQRFVKAERELTEYIYRRVARDRPRLAMKVPRLRRA